MKHCFILHKTKSEFLAALEQQVRYDYNINPIMQQA